MFSSKFLPRRRGAVAATILAGSLLGSGAAAASPAHLSTRPVLTRISLHQQDVSQGSLGGELKDFTVTLLPSDRGATYGAGTVTLGCATVSHRVLTFQQIPGYHEPAVLAVSSSEPGASTLATVGHFVFSHSQPLCGTSPMGGPYTIYIRYSGGFAHGRLFAPDTFCAVPVVPEAPGSSATSTQRLANLAGCRDTASSASSSAPGRSG